MPQESSPKSHKVSYQTRRQTRLTAALKKIKALGPPKRRRLHDESIGKTFIASDESQIQSPGTSRSHSSQKNTPKVVSKK